MVFYPFQSRPSPKSTVTCLLSKATLCILACEQILKKFIGFQKFQNQIMFQDIRNNFDFDTPTSFNWLKLDYSPKLHFTELTEESESVSQIWRPKM